MRKSFTTDERSKQVKISLLSFSECPFHPLKAMSTENFDIVPDSWEKVTANGTRGPLGSRNQTIELDIDSDKFAVFLVLCRYIFYCFSKFHRLRLLDFIYFGALYH